jgi:hypothetical protein
MAQDRGLTIACKGKQVGSELMKVGPANATVANPQLKLARAGLWLRDIHQLHLADALERNSLHDRTLPPQVVSATVRLDSGEYTGRKGQSEVTEGARYDITADIRRMRD